MKEKVSKFCHWLGTTFGTFLLLIVWLKFIPAKTENEELREWILVIFILIPLTMICFLISTHKNSLPEK
jgi:hypothetical protein